MKRFLTVFLLALGGAQAQSADPDLRYVGCHLHTLGTTSCSRLSYDALGKNYSTVQMRERNDTLGLTYLVLECRGNGRYEMFLESKNPLMTRSDFDGQLMPDVMFRIDNGPLKSLAVGGVFEVMEDGAGQADLNTVGALNDRILTDALMGAKNRVQMVVQRRGGLVPLTYDFPVAGFSYGVQFVNFCSDR